jgi:hypothetical protein
MKIYLLGISLCLSILMPSMASAITVLGTDSYIALNDDAYVDGTNAAAPSNFNNELMTLGNETLSGTVAISEIPYLDLSSSLYFEFIYDMQETGGNSNGGLGGRPISIDDIVVSVNGTTIWDYDASTYGSILLNGTTAFTDTPLGAGGDMALYVPVALFNGLGFTGSDALTLTVTQSDADNGTDEWIVQGSGAGGMFFSAADVIIDSSAVPVPAAMWLFGSGLLGLVGMARRKKTA